MSSAWQQRVSPVEPGRTDGDSAWKTSWVPCANQPGTDAVMAEQVAYYRAVAAEYESHGLQAPGGEELVEAIESFRPEGSVLELACGRGRWTAELLRYATEVTAVDAAPEMLAAAAEHLGQEPRPASSRATSSIGAPRPGSMSCSSVSCSPTCRKSTSRPFGRSLLTAWRPVGGPVRRRRLPRPRRAGLRR